MPSAQTYAPDGASKDNARGQKNTISDPFTLNGNVYRTETVATLKDGNVISSEVKFQKQVTGRSGKTFTDTAITRNGGKDWVTPGSGRGSNENKPITTLNTNLTTQEIKDLQPGGRLNKTSIESAKLAVKKNGGSDAQASAAATSKPQATPEAGTNTTPTPAAVPVDLKKEIESSKKTRKSYPNLRYPLDLANTMQDVIKFTILEYQPKKFSDLKDNAGLGGFSPRDDKRKGIGSVVLPIPSGISDTNSCEWGSDSMNAAEAFSANAALTGITKGMSKMVDEAGKIIEEGSKSQDVKTGLAAFFAGLATNGNAGQILKRTEGAVLNPNMELLFNGPTLRPFSFTFKMSARSKKEAEQIIGIIRFFKQGMSPQKSESNLFLKSPNTFKIQYLHLGENGKDHPYIGRIKECALESVVVSYTPHGEYATYTDGVMVSYDMQMQFKELEPIFNDDYPKDKDVSIGF
jgi:hypothetical protein